MYQNIIIMTVFISAAALLEGWLNVVEQTIDGALFIEVIIGHVQSRLKAGRTARGSFVVADSPGRQLGKHCRFELR